LVEEEIARGIEWATEQKDKQLASLISKLDEPYPAKKEEFLVPILLLEVTYNADWSPNTVKVVGDKPKYLICSKQLLGSIIDKMTSRHYFNGTKDGLTDREKGWNLTLYKKTKNNKTEYSAEGWREPYEMPEKYYRELPDAVLFTKKGMMSNDYLSAVIRNYLYAEPTIEEELRYPELKEVKDASAQAESEAASSAPPRRGPAKAQETVQEATVVEEEEEPAPAAAPPKKAPAKAPAKKAAAPKSEATEETAAPAKTSAPPRRNVLDDLSNL
jgi:hypothetical protein